MKISKINITSFGKFKNYSLDVCDGFNLIYGENENGKTTIMDFIRMMFYGSKNANKAGYVNPRKRYAPWDGSAMSGSIEFSHENKNYRLERAFRGRNSSDKITLISLDDGTLTNISGDDSPGESFLGLTLSAFEKSVFIDNRVIFSDTEGAGEINSRLANIEGTGDETVSSASVIKRVTDAIYDLRSASNRGGSIHKDEQLLQLLEDKLAEAKNIDRLRIAKAELIAQKEMDAAALSTKKSQAFNDIKGAEKAAKYLKLKEFVQTAEEYERCETKLLLSDGSVADKAFCDTLRQKITDIKIKQTALDAKRQESDRILDEISLLEKSVADDNVNILSDALNRKEKLSAELENRQTLLNRVSNDIAETEKQQLALKGHQNIPLIIIGAVLTVAFAVVPFITNLLYLLSFAAVGIILLVLGLTLKTKPDIKPFEVKLQDLNTKKSQLITELEDLKTSVQTANDQYNLLLVNKSTDQNLITSKRADATRVMTEVSSMQLALGDSLHDTLSFCARLKSVADIDSAQNVLEETENLLVSLEQLRAKAEYAAKGTGCHNLTQAKEYLVLLERSQGDGVSADIEQLKAELERLTNEHSLITQELAGLKAEAAKEYANIKSPAQIENDIELLKNQISQKEEYLDILRIAQEALNDADTEHRRSFSHLLDEKALAIFKQITDNKYDSLMISKELDISVSSDSSHGTQKLSNLSRGANDQAYFALRLALSELIGEQAGKLPILLDDIFSQYDDKRQVAAFEFLKNYSKDNQILFFTCHNSCTDTAKQLNANIIKL